MKVEDNTAAVLALIESNTKAALHAMGELGVECVIDKMQSGYNIPHKTYLHVGGRWEWNGDYHTDIWMSGDLERSITSAVENSGKNTVDIGTNIEYAHFVHDGTYFMEARPFLRDGIEDNIDEITGVAESYITRGL